MNKFVIIEVGSTNTKAYLYENETIINLGRKTIEFKNNYKKNQDLNDNDKKALYEFINEIKEENIYVYGTSIFRNLNTEKKHKWLKEFKKNTNLDFQIVSSDMENELTVYGAIANLEYKGKIAVMIGGGGSTELSIIENKKIIEKANYNFGTGDITDLFPDLKEDYAKTNYDKMLNKTKEMLKKTNNNVDLMILAGGDFIYFYEEANYPLENNHFYNNNLQPYCLDTKTMDKYDRNFFYNVSLTEIGIRTNEVNWWKGTRGMRLCVKAIVDTLNVKYIIPTKISMVYGLVEKIKKEI